LSFKRSRKKELKMLKKESKYSFLYQAHDGSIMRPENFLNINGGRTLSSSQLRALRINKIKNTSFKRQATSLTQLESRIKKC